MVLKKELIAVGESFSSREEALLTIANRFVDAGYARGSYPQAIIERERVFPTGLPAEAFDIAISHCDSEHVLESAIGASVLERPVEFCMMGNLSDEPLHPIIIFMLAIKDPKCQVPTLQKMMEVIQNKHLLEQLRGAASEEEVFDLLAPALRN